MWEASARIDRLAFDPVEISARSATVSTLRATILQPLPQQQSCFDDMTLAARAR